MPAVNDQRSRSRLNLCVLQETGIAGFTTIAAREEFTFVTTYILAFINAHGFAPSILSCGARVWLVWDLAETGCNQSNM